LDSFFAVAENTKLYCQICHKPTSPSGGTIGDLIQPVAPRFICKQLPDFDPHGFICFDDLNRFRRDYVKEVLQTSWANSRPSTRKSSTVCKRQEILSQNIGRNLKRSCPLASGFPIGSRPSAGAETSS
jgi:hypothetical protein